MSTPAGRHFLQIPGPTNVPDRVLRAMDMPTIDHRGPEFARLTLEILQDLKAVFKTSCDSIGVMLGYLIRENKFQFSLKTRQFTKNLRERPL